MNLDAALRFAAKGDSILFLGAGFSLGAHSLNDAPFVSGRKLSEQIANAVGLPIDTPLTLGAEVFREQQGTDSLIGLIKPAFTAKVPVPPYHAAIASTPWRRIYTTNYDDLFEKSTEANGNTLFSITLSDRIQNIPKGSRCCIHLNGYVGKLDRASIESELKLTDSSYLHNAILDSEWAILLRQDLRLAKAVVFIGYSLYDYEIRKLLTDIPFLKDKTFFVLGRTPNPVLLKQLEQYGTPVCKSTEEFSALIAPAIAAAHASGDDEVPEHYVALQEFIASADSEKPKDADQWRLFLQGVGEPRHIQFSLSSGDSFALRRTKTDDILGGLRSGVRLFAVLSELGNGKTLFLQTLQFDLAAQGYRVFWVQESGVEAEKELSYLAAQQGKKAFILEGYADRLSLVETFCIHSSPDAAMIITARTSVHDLFAEPLRDKLHGKSLVELRLDVLDSRELDWFSKLFTRYGMWGDRAGLSDHAKQRVLSRDCHCQVQGILLHLLESPQIQQRLTTLFGPLTGEPKYQAVLICIMIISVLGFSLTVDALEDVFGYEVISDPEFRRNQQIRQLVGFDSFRVNIRSPIVAQFFLTHFADKTSTLAVLLRLALRGDKARYAGGFFWSIFEGLHRFSLIQRIFPKEGKLAVVTSYYEEIKSLSGCVKNFHFWLQYAIACLTLGERD